MLKALHLHPGSRCAAVSRIEAAAARPGPGALALRYGVSGTVGALRLPPPAAPERADELWQHTCFEAFLQAEGGRYYEFNFAPSTQWAAYGFDGYREGMRPLTDIGMPEIEIRCGAGRFELQALLKLDRLAGPAPGAPWRLGLSAVIEETDGNRSFWALAHPPGRPDFHHSDCFALELRPTSRP